MKIFTAAQIRAWDAYTITNEPISSVELMNRAARTFTGWFRSHYPNTENPVVIFAGPGNNGGDGLAIARYLHQCFYDAKVLVYNFGEQKSVDFEAQFAATPPHGAVDLDFLEQSDTVPAIPGNAIVIDALFGSGLNRPLTGPWAQLVAHINQLPNEVVSVDIPSGLFADKSSAGCPVVQADHTFSFETPKSAFFFPENADRVGDLTFASIGLHPDYAEETSSDSFYLTAQDAASLRISRKKYAHKGTFGHTLLVGGSYGKMGAITLAAKACLRAGAGLLSVHAPRCGYLVLQTAVPEAMFSGDERARICTGVADPENYTAIGAGPGLGTAPETMQALEQLLHQTKAPMVLDADALNMLAMNPDWWRHIPENSILTPHLREFERLFGAGESFERNALQRRKAQEHGVYIILKGAHTAIAAPDGSCWFNSSGNAGMATGGSGDVLTGILTGLLAQGYDARAASLLGVYLHGLAGDIAAELQDQEALIAGDIVSCLGQAWKRLGQ